MHLHDSRQESVANLKKLFAGRVLIIGDFESYAAVNVFADTIVKAGGRVDQIHNHRIVLAYLPDAADEAFRGNPKVRVFSREAVDLATEPFVSDEVATGIGRHFNRTLDGSLLRDIEALTEESMPPLDDHVVVPPRRARSGVATQQVRAATFTNEYMTGRIGIQIHFVESSGAVDTNEFTWNSTDRGTIVTRSAEGYDWWDAEAFARSITMNQSVAWKNANDYAALSQPYEPIRHDVRHASHLWINPIMAGFGYTQTDANAELQAIIRVEDYNADFQSAATADSAHSIFVIYNPSPAPTTHTDGYYTLSYFGGPWIDHPFRPGGYSISSWGWVYAHEMGHTFWACDEYGANCTGCDYCHEGDGPRGYSSNGNCEDACNASPDDCIMLYPNPNFGVCSYTETQIGW